MNNTERQQGDYIYKHLRVVCAVFFCEKKILACRRPQGKNMAGLWEFPGGKVEQGESDTEALIREIQEEMKMTIKPGLALPESFYDYGSFSITLCPFLVPVPETFLPEDGEHDAFLWVGSEKWKELNWPAADLPVLEHLEKIIDDLSR